MWPGDPWQSDRIGLLPAGGKGLASRSRTPSAVFSTMNSVPGRHRWASRTDFVTRPFEESRVVSIDDLSTVRFGKTYLTPDGHDAISLVRDLSGADVRGQRGACRGAGKHRAPVSGRRTTCDKAAFSRQAVPAVAVRAPIDMAVRFVCFVAIRLLV